MRKPAFIEIAYLKSTPEYKIIERYSAETATSIADNWCHVEKFNTLINDIKKDGTKCCNNDACKKALNYLVMLHVVTFGGAV